MATITANNPISQVDALWALFEHQPKAVRKAFVRKLAEKDIETEKQKKLVKDSLNNALNEVKLAQEGKIQLEDARDLFK